MKKGTSDRKRIILSVAAVAVAIVAIVVGVIVSQEVNLDENYFKSDDTKLVMSLNKATAAFEEGEYEPEVTHLVYYYNGDSITGARVYFEYADEEDAKEANNNINMKNKDWTNVKKQNGKYIIFEVLKSKYDGLTTEMVRQNIESMRAAGGTIDADVEDESEASTDTGVDANADI